MVVLSQFKSAVFTFRPVKAILAEEEIKRVRILDAERLQVIIRFLFAPWITLFMREARKQMVGALFAVAIEAPE